MNRETSSVENMEPDVGNSRPTRNTGVRKGKGKCGGHIPPSINPFNSHLAPGMKALKSGVCRDDPSCTPNLPCTSPEHRALVWAACAIKVMGGCSWKQLLCHLSSPFFLQVKVWDPIHLSSDSILTLSDLMAAHTLCHRMKSQDDGGVSLCDVKHLLGWEPKSR